MERNEENRETRWHSFALAISVTNFDVLDLNEALERPAEKDADLARTAELRFFAGLEVTETAVVLGALGIDPQTRMARWLKPAPSRTNSINEKPPRPESCS